MSSIGLYETVPLSDVRDQAKMMLRMQSDNSVDDEVEFWIIKGLGRLNCLSTLKKFNCEIEVCENMAKLPKGLVRLIAFRVPLGSAASTALDWNSPNFAYYYDAPFFKNYGISGNNDWGSFGNFCQVNNGHLIFNYPLAVDTIEISYIGANVDNCGNRIIYLRYMDALAAFSAYNIGRDRMHEGVFAREQIQLWRSEWINQRNMIISEDQKNSFREKKNEIRAIMLSEYYSPRLLPNG
jgi:hypothetical protein